MSRLAWQIGSSLALVWFSKHAANNSHVCIITDDVIEGEEMDPTVEVLCVLTNHGVMLEAVTWERVQ